MDLVNSRCKQRRALAVMPHSGLPGPYPHAPSSSPSLSLAPRPARAHSLMSLCSSPAFHDSFTQLLVSAIGSPTATEGAGPPRRPPRLSCHRDSTLFLDPRWRQKLLRHILEPRRPILSFESQICVETVGDNLRLQLPMCHIWLLHMLAS
jgi:hypothetical protein